MRTLVTPVVTTIRTQHGFSIIVPCVAQWAEIDGATYITDGRRTWLVREVLSSDAPPAGAN